MIVEPASGRRVVLWDIPVDAATGTYRVHYGSHAHTATFHVEGPG